MRDAAMRPLASCLPNFGARIDESEADAPVDQAAEDRTHHVDDIVWRLRLDDTMARSSQMVEDALAFAALQIQAARASWSKECEERLCREAALARESFAEEIVKSLVSALSPLVAQRQRERIVEAFTEELSSLLGDMPDVAVTIDGPVEETRIIASSLGRRGIECVTRAAGGERVEARLGATIVRANLSKWRDLCAAEMAGEASDDE